MLPTIRLKNGTVTVAIAVKNGTVKKTENGTDTVRYGDKFGRTIVYRLANFCMRSLIDALFAFLHKWKVF